MRKTKSTTTYKKWDIILVPFPFTEKSANKRRPALVVSPTAFNRGSEIVVAFMTSNVKVRTRTGDHRVVDWIGAKLPKPTLIRMRFASISKSIVVRRLGKLTKKDAQQFSNKLIAFFA